MDILYTWIWICSTSVTCQIIVFASKPLLWNIKIVLVMNDRQRLIRREAFREESWKKIYYLSYGNGVEMRWLLPFMRWPTCRRRNFFGRNLLVLTLLLEINFVGCAREESRFPNSFRFSIHWLRLPNKWRLLFLDSWCPKEVSNQIFTAELNPSWTYLCWNAFVPLLVYWLCTHM